MKYVSHISVLFQWFCLLYSTLSAIKINWVLFCTMCIYFSLRTGTYITDYYTSLLRSIICFFITLFPKYMSLGNTILSVIDVKRMCGRLACRGYASTHAWTQSNCLLHRVGGLSVQNWRWELHLYFCSFIFKIQSIGHVEKCSVARIGPWRDLVGCQ